VHAESADASRVCAETETEWKAMPLQSRSVSGQRRRRSSSSSSNNNNSNYSARCNMLFPFRAAADATTNEQLAFC